MPNLNILIICNCASGLDTFRGMLITELINQKNSVTAIVPQTDEEKEIIAEKNLINMNCGLIHIKMERRGINPFHDFKLAKNYYKTVKRLKPDLIITYTIKPNIYGGVVARLFKINYVANITGLGTAFQGDGMLKKLVTLMYKVALKKAKTVFFENKENQDIMLNLGIVNNAQSHLLAGAGVDLQKFSFKEYPPQSETVNFLFIGRVMQEKGINELFCAMQKLVAEKFNCVLNVVGDFEEDYSQKITEFEKEGWLKYHGYQSDVRPFISDCQCFVLPSWHEGMANTILECAASGRPIIATNISGCKEAVINGKSGMLCEPKNADSLYNVMKDFMLLSYEQKKSMALQSRKHIETNFDKKKVVEETIKYL